MSADPWAALRRHTPARIALGRSGGSLPTSAVLAFAAAHALARDAVHVPLDVPALAAALQADHWPTLQVTSRAPDRASYLRRPDLGRRLDADSAERLAGWARQHGGLPAIADVGPEMGPPRGPATGPERAPGMAPDTVQNTPACTAPNTAPYTAPNTAPDVALVVADGLAAAAAQQHAVAVLGHLRQALAGALTLSPVVLATQARVALADEVGALLQARSVLVLLGERPGLSAPDSLGAYLTHAPRLGRSDAERNCVSNIRPAGLACDAAAGRLAWLLREALRRGLSGVALKDAHTTPLLAVYAPET